MARTTQLIRFCRSRDGTRIAYATSGSGPPLVKAANYLTHLEHDWNGPVWHHWLRDLGARRTIVRYDARGCGLSDRVVDDLAMDKWVDDLAAVVDALDLERFPLLGISQGASVCIAYAARHPERVSRLVLYGGYARGRFNRDLTAEQRVEAETLIAAMRVGWGQENPAFRQLFSTQLMPEATPEQTRWLNELARISAQPEHAAAMERAFYHIDVSTIAPSVSVPALVLHARRDAAIPFEEGRLLASLLPDARLVPLESRNHILTEQEPAWGRFLEELDGFLESGPGADAVGEPFAALTQREREVLDHVARGLSNAEVGQNLFISEKTVRNHITSVFSKLGVSRRAEAIVLARDAGFGRSEA